MGLKMKIRMKIKQDYTVDYISMVSNVFNIFLFFFIFANYFNIPLK